MYSTTFFYTLKLTISSIVEFATTEEAQGAIKQLSESMFLGRPVYLREVCCVNEVWVSI